MDQKLSSDRVERWGIVELSLDGPRDADPGYENPFVDVQFGARFQLKNRAVDVDGFYDGDGAYRVRFMPDALGTWRYVTWSNSPELDGKSGEFVCGGSSSAGARSPGNHGPVSVRNTYHFCYADGTPHVSIGTTCYAWAHQGDELEERTLETLEHAPFTKMRMCVFPKDYAYNKNEPTYYPFQRNTAGGWDFTRFDPAFWRHFEQRVGQLRDLGIEADLILFHPYDRWGFATMDAESDDRYLRYAVARLAAYRNVWWSMANEFDLMKEKTMADWDRFFHIVQEGDPYQHMRSVHNCRQFYDHNKPWVTHCSIQRSDLDQVQAWRQMYRKPVVVDECCYEGTIPQGWGNISAREMVHRFWLGTVGGGYVGHGETYLHPQDVLWWSKGGVLHGQSPARIAFLRQILQEGPAQGLDPVDRWGAGQHGEYYLHYFGVRQPGRWTFDLPEGQSYQVEVIDTWEMTVTPLQGTFSGTFQVELPGRPYLAVRIRRL
jgi:hypothetical protein